MKSIKSVNAPKAIGPYSQAIIHNDFIFCSGQIGIDPKTGLFAGTDIASQTKKAIENIEGILKVSKSDLSKVIKVDVFLKNMNDFKIMNEIYSNMFKTLPLPARVTVGVSKLPKNALVEIACTAISK